MGTSTIKPPTGFVLDEPDITAPPEGFVVDQLDFDQLPDELASQKDKIRNSHYYSQQFGLEPEAAYDMEPQLNEEVFGSKELSDNPAVLFYESFKQSLADKPAMMLKGAEVYTPGRALGMDTVLDKSSTFLRSLQDPDTKEQLQKVASGKLWPTGDDKRWWQVEAQYLPEVINSWAVNVADQIPIMLATIAGRMAGKAIGKPLGAVAGLATTVVTAGPDPSDVATAPPVAAITSEVVKHLGGAAPLIAMEAGNFMDEADNLEIDRDIAEKYAKGYGLGSGAIEYAQWLWVLGRYSKIGKPMQKTIMKEVLGHIGGSMFEGVEEVSQQGLQNFLLQKAVAEMKERHPDYQGQAPKITEGLKRSGQIGAGVAFITGMPGTGMTIADGALARRQQVKPETKKFLGEPSVQEVEKAAEKPTEPTKTPETPVVPEEPIVAPPELQQPTEAAPEVAEKVEKIENQEVFKFMTKQEQQKAFDVAIKSDDFEGSKEDFVKSFNEAIFDAKTGEIIESGGTVIISEPLRKPIAPEVAEKKPKEPTTLREDVTGILGGLPQEPAGLTKAEVEHLGRREQNALRAAQRRGLKVGFKQGVAATIKDARQSIATLITKQKLSEQNRMDLASIVLTHVPKEHQNRFIRRLLKVQPGKATQKLTVQIHEAVEKLAERRSFRKAKGELIKQIKRIPKFGRAIKLRQPAIDKIETALTDVDITALSASKKAELKSIRNDLKQVGFEIQKEFEVPSEEELSGIEFLVGERVVKQLERLQKESISTMSAEEVDAIADAIRYALNQNTKQTKENKKKRAEQSRKHKESSVKEITPTRASRKMDNTKPGIVLSLPGRVYQFFRQDSMKRWALVESATEEGLNTTATVLDENIHEGKSKATAKQFEALELLWKEMDRLGWSQTDIDRINELHNVTLGGKKYELTTAEIMSLGMNIRSARNEKQIVRTKSLWIANRKVNTPTVGEIVDAMDILSDKEMAVMNFLPTLNEKILMPAINEVSEEMLGFTLAKDPFYWGLRRKMTRKVRGRVIHGPAIEDIGAFQPFLGSKIALKIVPFWDQLLTQIQNTSSLYGLAMPMENARTLLNNAEWQEAMDNAGRKRERQNLLTIFERTQGIASDRDNVDIVGSTLLARAGKAILGWRISTMANQTASIPIALTIIPNKYAVPISGIQVQRGSAQSTRIDKYSPILKMRHIGGRTNIVTGDAAARNRVDHLIFRKPADLSLEGMRRTDRFAIEAIDMMVQRWVADTTRFKHGTDNYWKEVARRTEEVVRKTQPMWDVDERSVLGSNPNVIYRSMFIFRSAREAVLNQNLMAIDRAVKAEDKDAAIRHLANTLAATTVSTAMVVGVRTAMWATTGAVLAGLTGRERPDKDKKPEERSKDFVGDMLEATVEYLPLGRVIAGAIKVGMKKKTWDELDPDAILFGGVVATARTAAHLNGAYQAYFEDNDEDKLKKELIGAMNDAADAIGRLKGYPTGGIMQLTTQPLERALRESETKRQKIGVKR